jgi:manganese transport protein
MTDQTVDTWATATRETLPEVRRSLPKPGGFWRRLLAFVGPGYLVAVGYMDPGNWATDIAGGSAFGYTLLSVVLLSSLMAMLLQGLALRLGIATGRDLAQACRDRFSRPVVMALWLLCEVAIIACDLAEVVGTAIALKLLFGLPLLAGALLTTLDTLLVLLLQRYGFRRLEAFIMSLLAVIALCFAVELALAQPVWGDVLKGLMPTTEVVTNPQMLLIAIGILGATVMPHNLYLHSALVRTRRIEPTVAGKQEATRLATIDSTVALVLAFFVNAAILIVAAAAFHVAGRNDVADIEQAHALLAPLLGVPVASAIFAVALLASGQNSTVTATLAGQIVMEGFLELRLPPWLRRMVTRLLAVVPAVVVLALFGDGGTTPLLILSQVVLSLQLPFAVLPLVLFTGDRRLMGALVTPPAWRVLAWLVAAAIVGLNLTLLADVAGLF